MKWGRRDSWGTWHTGPAAPGPCPQPQCRGAWHDVQEAAALNVKDREFKQAVLYESMRRWREK